jgi:hypothetical protein
MSDEIDVGQQRVVVACNEKLPAGDAMARNKKWIQQHEGDRLEVSEQTLVLPADVVRGNSSVVRTVTENQLGGASLLAGIEAAQRIVEYVVRGRGTVEGHRIGATRLMEVPIEDP